MYDLDASKIRPRNDHVLLRMQKKQRRPGDLDMPDIAAEGKEFVVVAVGPKVEGLAPGDKVCVIGERGVNWDFLPGSRDLFTTTEVMIPLVYESAIDSATRARG